MYVIFRLSSMSIIAGSGSNSPLSFNAVLASSASPRPRNRFRSQERFSSLSLQQDGRLQVTFHYREWFSLRVF